MVARSVKFLGKLEATLTDQETREGWWEDLRDEIKGHARTLCCTHIVGYRERCSLVGDVCVLSSEGTAAVVKSLQHPALSPSDWEHNTPSTSEWETPHSPVDRDLHHHKVEDEMEDKTHRTRKDSDEETPRQVGLTLPPLLKKLEKKRKLCTAVHVPYNSKLAPFSFMRLVPCGVCKRKWVPEVVFPQHSYQTVYRFVVNHAY